MIRTPVPSLVDKIAEIAYSAPGGQDFYPGPKESLSLVIIGKNDRPH